MKVTLKASPGLLQWAFEGLRNEWLRRSRESPRSESPLGAYYSKNREQRSKCGDLRLENTIFWKKGSITSYLVFRATDLLTLHRGRLAAPGTGLQPVLLAQMPLFILSLKSTVIIYKALNLHCQHEPLSTVLSSQPRSQLLVCWHMVFVTLAVWTPALTLSVPASWPSMLSAHCSA